MRARDGLDGAHALSGLPDPCASNVIPLRWTARGFLRAGIVFVTEGGTISVKGPPNREDLRQALVAEVQRRVDVFARFAPLDRSVPFPRVALPGVPSVRSDACDACGDALDVGRGGMCPLCTFALQKVLRAAGRI